MASIEDIKKLLESKSFTSARDLDELEEKPDDKQNEVRLNCEPMVGMVEKEGKIFRSTKGEGHGLGMKRMDAIIERLEGYVSRNSEDGAFTTEILLPQV